MKMRYLLIAMGTLVGLISLVGSALAVYMLTTNFGGLISHNRFVLDNDNISFTLPRVWEPVSSDNVEITLNNFGSPMTMRVYKRSDLDIVMANDLLELRVREELQQFDSHNLVRDLGVTNVNGRRIYSRLYAVEREGVQTQYFFSVVEFLGSETYVYVQYETREVFMKYHINDIGRLLRRMKWEGEGIDIAMR